MATIGNNYSSSRYMASIDDAQRKLDIEEMFANGPQIPRAKMPQVDREYTNDVLLHFAHKYKVYKENNVPIATIKPTQKDYDFGKVKQRVANGVAWSDTPFFVDKNYRLLDGHHRWAQGMFQEPGANATVFRLPMDHNRAIKILNALKYTYQTKDDGTHVNKTGDYVPGKVGAPIQQPLSEALLEFLSECIGQDHADEVTDIVKEYFKITTEDLNDELRAYAEQKKKSEEDPDKAKENSTNEDLAPEVAKFGVNRLVKYDDKKDKNGKASTFVITSIGKDGSYELQNIASGEKITAKNSKQLYLNESFAPNQVVTMKGAAKKDGVIDRFAIIGSVSANTYLLQNLSTGEQLKASESDMVKEGLTPNQVVGYKDQRCTVLGPLGKGFIIQNIKTGEKYTVSEGDVKDPESINENRQDPTYHINDIVNVKGKKEKGGTTSQFNILAIVEKKALVQNIRTGEQIEISVSDIQPMETINESAESKDFKDTKGKTPKVGDFIASDNGDIGKVKAFSSDKDGGRMNVDFNSHYLELNPKSTFTIIEATDKMKKAFL